MTKNKKETKLKEVWLSTSLIFKRNKTFCHFGFSQFYCFIGIDLY